MGWTLGRYFFFRYVAITAWFFLGIAALIFLIDFTELAGRTARLPGFTYPIALTISALRAPMLTLQMVPFVGLFSGHVKWSIVPHLVLALAAIAVVVVRWRKLPVSWLVFVGLYLVPSLQLGMVGVGRYANECFPPFVAAGQVLERVRTRWLVLAFAVSALGLVAFAYVSGHYELVP